MLAWDQVVELAVSLESCCRTSQDQCWLQVQEHSAVQTARRCFVPTSVVVEEAPP